MSHSTASTTRRTSQVIRRPSRRARGTAGRALGLGPEALESRVVPTVVFSPLDGQPTAFHDGGGALSNNTPVYLVFWGNYFKSNTSPTSNGATAEYLDTLAAEQILSSSFFSGLGQYAGSPNKLYFAGSYNDYSAVTVNASSIVNELVNDYWAHTVPPPAGNWPIYVVVTPPGATDSTDPSADGWNIGYPVGYLSQSDAWVSTTDPNGQNVQSSVDKFSAEFSHEVTEAKSDPVSYQNQTVAQSVGVEVGPGRNFPSTDNSQQISDYEAELHNYRIGGTMVQSYWSQQNSAFIVPDGNSFQFYVGGGNPGQFSEGSGQTLTIIGGQNGFFYNDSVTLNRTTGGVVSATYDGQTVQFDGGAISDVVVDQPLFGSLSVSITGYWSGSDTSKPPITIIGSPVSTTTINITPVSGGLANLPGGLVSIDTPSNKSSLYINNQADYGSHFWTLNGGSVGLDGWPLVSYSFGAPNVVDLTTGLGVNNIDVEGSPCVTIINDVANTQGTLCFAEYGRSLAAIQNLVDLIGGASALYLYDQADTSSEAVTFDGGSITEPNMFPFFAAGIGSVYYYAGSGSDTFNVTPNSKTLDNLPANLTLYGASYDSLVVNDSQHAAPTVPSGAFARNDLYTMTGTSITRTTQVWYGFTPTTTSRVINFYNIQGLVTLDADNYGTPVSIAGTYTATTVNLGTSGTGVYVTGSSESLLSLGGNLSIVGDASGNSLVVYDQMDPGYWNSTGPAAYTLGSSSIARTDYYNIYAYPYGWVNVYTTRTISYSDMAYVTFDADIRGTPIDVEGITAATTVNLGSGNTAVTVSKTAQSLSPFTFLTYFPKALTLNGGSGVNTLVVDDQQDGYGAGLYGYTVSSGAISRLNYYGPSSDANPTVATINYQNFGGGVTLNTDNNGTAVDVEGISAPTTIDVGTGNTPVTVTASGKNLNLLGADLTVNGNTGFDSLSVNDSLNPYASSITGTGINYRSTSYSYGVTGSFISRTQVSSTSTYLARFTRYVNYSSMFGGVTLATDNNGTPVDVESTSSAATINIGSGNTAVSVTAYDQSLLNLVGGGPLTVNGGTGTDTLSVNDTLTALLPTSIRVGTRLYTTSYYYTVTGSYIARTQLSTGLLIMRTTRSVNYANIKGGVTFGTDNVGTPVYVSGSPGTVPVTLSGGTGTNTLYGPAMANSWGLTGANSGSLDGWVNFTGFANLNGGGVSDSFDFNPAGSLSGNINGEGGNDLLNYARVSTAVSVNLATGKATGVGGIVSGVQGAVGGSGTNSLTGSGRSLLIGGSGTSQLAGGTSDSLMIAGTTIYDLNDVALEAILDEWDRTDIGFTQRVTDLTSGGSGALNGSNYLTLSTISSNGKANTITSNAGQAWIFARTSDVIVNRKSSDLVTTLP